MLGVALITLFFLVMLPFQVDFSTHTRQGQYITMTPATFPTMTIVLMLAATGIYLYSLWRRRGSVSVEEDKDDPTDMKPVLITVAVLLIYTALLEIVGFLVATILLCSILSYIYKGRWYEILITGIILPILFYNLFKLLYVPLPRGIWF